jgi:SAM-dependent methyltransferase
MGEVVWHTYHPLFKAVYRIQKKVRRSFREKLEECYYQLNLARSHRAVRRVLGKTEPKYDVYLRDQLQETLRKKRLKREVHLEVIPLIDMLASKYDIAGKSILCIGCRNTDEIRHFRKRGAGHVIGIDLYSSNPEILIMDMHDLKFPDGSFDVVYSRHSFEHAFDKQRAAQEFMRVLRSDGLVVIEVPGKYKGGADYNRFDDVDDVLVAFAPSVGDCLWKEYSRKEENADKMDIIRLMFRIKKQSL